MHPNNFKLACAVPLILLLGLSACLGGGSKAPATRYYVLNSLYTAEKETQPVVDLKEAIVVIGPLTLTQVLDRPHIIIRHSQNEIRVANLDRWAEPLHENFTRVLRENLSALISQARVIRFPPAASIPVAYQVIIEVMRFDGNPQNEVVLRAQWAVLGGEGDSVLLKRQSDFKEPSEGDTIAEMVSAQSRLVAKLSRDIAEALKTLEEQRAGK